MGWKEANDSVKVAFGTGNALLAAMSWDSGTGVFITNNITMLWDDATLTATINGFEIDQNTIDVMDNMEFTAADAATGVAAFLDVDSGINMDGDLDATGSADISGDLDVGGLINGFLFSDLIEATNANTLLQEPNAVVTDTGLMILNGEVVIWGPTIQNYEYLYLELAQNGVFVPGATTSAAWTPSATAGRPANNITINSTQAALNDIITLTSGKKYDATLSVGVVQAIAAFDVQLLLDGNVMGQLSFGVDADTVSSSISIALLPVGDLDVTIAITGINVYNILALSTFIEIKEV